MVRKREKSARRIANEAAVQDFVAGLIRSGTLLSAIEGVEDIRQAASAGRSSRTTPTLSIDALQRMRTILGADEALTALDQLEIVSDNLSISRKSGEILRPDFVLFNRSLGKIVLVELKDDALPERQAITELLAYERELRNHFPFLGEMEIVFVLIARNWGDLLNHAYAGLAARGRPALLALNIVGENPDFRLSVRTDEAWTRLYRLSVDAAALRSRSYRVLFRDREAAYALAALLNSADLMRQAADRAGQHGFCVVWEGLNDVIGLGFGVTVYAIDPGHLHVPVHPADPGRESGLTAFFKDVLSSGELRFQPSIDAIMDTLRLALGVSVEIEHIHDGAWLEDMEWLEHGGATLHGFRYWGVLADFAVDMGTSAAARRHYHFEDPPCVGSAIAGYQTITAVTGGQPFAGGRATARPLFDIGRLLRRAVDVAASDAPSPTTWEWVNLRLLPYLNEWIYLARSWMGAVGPCEPLRLFASPDIAAAANFTRFQRWMRELLDDHPLGDILQAGWDAEELVGSPALAADASCVDVCASIADAIVSSDGGGREWAPALSPMPPELKSAPGPSDLLEATSTILDPSRRIELLVNVADVWIPALRWRQMFIENVPVDIGDLRSGISDLLTRVPVDRLPSLLIDGDGMIGTIVVPRPAELAALDHHQKVAILNRSSGRDLLTIVDWEDVADGSVHVIASNVVGKPIDLKQWRPSHPRWPGLIDNRWLGGKINLNNFGLTPAGPPGARFLAVSFSESSVSELAIIINIPLITIPDQDWATPAYFRTSTGAINHSGARIGFIELRVNLHKWMDRYVMLFDICDVNVRRALDQLGRQLWVHFAIATEDGEVVAFQGAENTFDLDQLADAASMITPGQHQDDVDLIIRRDNGTIQRRLIDEVLTSAQCLGAAR